MARAARQSRQNRKALNRVVGSALCGPNFQGGKLQVATVLGDQACSPRTQLLPVGQDVPRRTPVNESAQETWLRASPSPLRYTSGTFIYRI